MATAPSHSPSCELHENNVIEIVPVEEYDSHRAKLKASLSWLLSKVYGSNVPKELQDPFYESAQGQLVLRPVMVNLMSTSELYCQACSNMFPETHTQWRGHWSIIQVLSRKGIYISDVQESAVTETVLVQTAPFRLKAHLSLIDALMKAFTYEVASVEKIVKAVRCMITFPASSELPSSPEEALQFWMNKVCIVLATQGVQRQGEGELLEGAAGQKVRVVSKGPGEPVQVPLLEDLVRDIGDGSVMAAVIAYYKPHLLNIKDVCLKENLGIADSLYNLRQVGQFCRHHLPWKQFHLSYEDFLYTHDMMKVNIIAFLSDLFYNFEGQGAAASSTTAAKEKIDAMPAAGKRSTHNIMGSIPISTVTKKSFQRQGFEDTASNLGMGRLSTSPNSYQPLLPRRTGRRSMPQEEGGLSSSPPTKRGGRRTLSLCSPQDREQIHSSDVRLRLKEDGAGDSGCNLLANVSIDSAMNHSLNANSSSLSLDLAELETPRLAKTLEPSHPDYLELESVASDRINSQTPLTGDQRLEPLMPAILKPTKEREVNLSKAEERGERLPRRKKVPSPSESHQFSPSQHPTAAAQPSQQQNQIFNTSIVSSDEISLPPALSTGGSYVVEDRASTAQAARAAGIPIVSDSTDLTTGLDRSREGSVASSGDYSDHESQKIHQDHKVRESGPTPTTSNNTANMNLNNSSSKPIMIIADHNSNTTTIGSDVKSSSPLTTNFAELKRLKDQLAYQIDKVDNSALIYMQSGSHGGPCDKLSGVDLKSTFASKQGQAQQSQVDSDKAGNLLQSPAPHNAAVEANGAETGCSELQQLRLKLEQKRKEIERKKHRQEAQQNKMRQRLGKAAFMRVVSKHLDGGDEDEIVEPARSESPLSSTQAQLQARLGHPIQKLPLGSVTRGQPLVTSHPLQLVAGQGSQSSFIPAETSAQRFTDWRTQTQMSKGGASGNLSVLATGATHPGQTDQGQQPFLLPHTGSDGGLDSSQKSGNKAFSREGIQQTIDNVRNKWFKNDSDLITGRGEAEEQDVGGELNSFRLHDHDLIGRANTRTIKEHSQSPPRSHSQSPHLGLGHQASASALYSSPLPSFPSPQNRDEIISDGQYQEYDSSLDQLTNSLSELQGEIMRLSLQHEQLKAAQSPVGGQASGFIARRNDALADGSSPAPVSTRPIHGIPQQAPYIHGAVPKQQQLQEAPSVPYQNYTTAMEDLNLALQAHDFSLTQQTRSFSESLSTGLAGVSPGSQAQLSTSTPNDGFFVSLGEEFTPKRSKPKLAEHRTRGGSPAPGPAAPVLNNDISATLATQVVLINTSPHKLDLPTDDGSSPNRGFIIKDELAIVKEQIHEDEMYKKKIKLMEMQRKRKEEQEKRRVEKEAEIAKKQEEKILKEEEQERKKAEERARREAIFQQYLQKKQEDEEDSPGVKPRPKKRDGSASKPRPKSMFVKTKAMTPEPGAPDSGSSSQEDLTARVATGGRSTPNVMSTMRSSYHFRLPQPSHIRKAVSCNTLQGPANGASGPSTYRRPPSPDLYRLKQQRQRGNSQDSGSETGSGSNPGSDYAGPKLFVKPSAKSNRHIIVNAISHCCLAGSVNTDMKNKVLEEMSKCDANHFLILFRDGGCQYRALFIFYPETEEAFKVHGVGPKHITNVMCEKFFKYNSGGKSFNEITSTKHLSVSVDAVVLQSSVWKSSKAVVKR